MLEMLTQRGRLLRPAAQPVPDDTGAVDRLLANYAVVATDVPCRAGVKSGFIRQGNLGGISVGDFSGFTKRDRDVKTFDVLEVDSVFYEVQSLGNIGTYLRQFDLSRVVLR